MTTENWWTNWDLSYTTDSFGPLYGGHSVQEAFYNTLQEWLPTYIAEINRQIGTTVLYEPYEYRHRPEFRTMPRGVSAAILVEVPNTIGTPQVYHNVIRTDWRVEVMVYVYGTKDWQETQALTSAYAAAVRGAIIQHRGLGGFAVTTNWEGEQYLEGEHTSGRTTGVAHLRFSVTVGNAMNVFAGTPSPQYAATGSIDYPSTDPPSPIPVVETAEVVVEKDHI
jgi:hypothetical protein